jgi:iron complex outermembrane receptor protein
VWSSWDLGCNWEFDLIGRYVDKLSGFNPSNPASVELPDMIPAYIALDARLAWRPCPHREIAIVGQNLTDNHHPENGTSAILLSPLIEIRRSVYAMVTVEW